jgi:hypothetical protein
MATVSGALTPLGMGLAGLAADLAGQDIARVYLACGAVQVLLAAAAGLSREFRRFLAADL